MRTETEQAPQMVYFRTSSKINRCASCINLKPGRKCFIVQGPSDGSPIEIYNPRFQRCDGYVDTTGNRIDGIN